MRNVERTGQVVAISRHGTVVARLTPSSAATSVTDRKPWEALRALGGELLADPRESVLQDEDFEASR